jgi:4-hydroxybutyryl-CoA dehydratase/vinylacetyl-CoA-Delta-isomerase
MSENASMYRSGDEYRESLRRYKPTVFVNGRRVESVADEPLLAPGIAGVAVTYDFALREDLAP